MKCCLGGGALFFKKLFLREFLIPECVYVDFSCKIAPLENYCAHTGSSAFAPQMRLLIKRIKRGEGIPLGTRMQIMRTPLTSQPL
jgi:hypothetical protein